LNTDIFEQGSLRITDDDSKKEREAVFVLHKMSVIKSWRDASALYIAALHIFGKQTCAGRTLD